MLIFKFGSVVVNKVQLILLKATIVVVIVIVDVDFVDVVAFNVNVVSLLVVADHIVSSCGQ